MNDESVRVDHEELRSFTQAILEDTGLNADHAETVARGLVRADLRGVNSHGVARLKPYVKKLEGGGFNTNPEITAERRGDSVVVVDGDDAPGQVAAMEGAKKATETAAEAGAGLVSVRNSNHFGTAARYTEFMADHGCIGITTTNSGAEVIPFGGREPLLGTNPIAVSFPTPGEIPITLDMATSIVAMGKVSHVAAKEGSTIPDHWAVDDQGQTTTDPEEVHALRPAAGPKGYGLGMTVDLLSGVLSGSSTSLEIGSLYDNYDEPQDVGHFFGAFDVSFFRDVSRYEAEIEDYIGQVKSIAPEEGVDEVMLPGEIEANAKARNRKEGVPVVSGVVEDLRALSDEYRVATPESMREK